MTKKIDITPIIEYVIKLVGVIITAYIIPLIKSKVSSAKWNNLCEFADVFVNCAEMIFRGTKLGKDKKKYVIEKLTALAEERGLNFSADAIEAAIENAVKQMNDNTEKLEIIETMPEISE